MKQLKKGMKDVFGYSFVISVLLLIVFVILVFGVGFMNLFGFQYYSFRTAVFYLIMVLIVTAPMESVAKMIPNTMLDMGRMSLPMARLLFILCDITATMTGLLIVDYYVKTVSISNVTVVIISIIFALIGVKDVGKKDYEENKENQQNENQQE